MKKLIIIMILALSVFPFSSEMFKLTGIEIDTLWAKNGATIDTALVVNGDLTVSGDIIGDITGDLTGKADSAMYADTATYATAALDADSAAHAIDADTAAYSVALSGDWFGTGVWAGNTATTAIYTAGSTTGAIPIVVFETLVTTNGIDFTMVTDSLYITFNVADTAAATGKTYYYHVRD